MKVCGPQALVIVAKKRPAVALSRLTLVAAS
jgi:hypothetical protein